MSIVTRGFRGRRDRSAQLPPWQYLVRDFLVLPAGPTPRVDPGTWRFVITAEPGAEHSWT